MLSFTAGNPSCRSAGRLPAPLTRQEREGIRAVLGWGVSGAVTVFELNTEEKSSRLYLYPHLFHYY